MALRASIDSDITKQEYWVGLLPNGTNVPIVTNHASGGTSQVVEVYIWDDGRRDSDGDMVYQYEYKNITFEPKGRRTRIITPNGQAVGSTNTQIPVENGSDYGAGTKLIVDPILNRVEEIWIRNVQGNNLIVDRAKNNTIALDIPSGTWVESKPDHIFLSLTGIEGEWVNNGVINLPDISQDNIPIKLFLRVSTGALRTQVKRDTFFQLNGIEYPKY